MVFPRSTENISAAQLRRTGSEVRRSTRRHADVNPIMLVPGSSSGQQNRDSRGSDTTVRRVSMSTATAGTASDEANGRASDDRYTFRELGSERQQPWTTQEKEEKWHALLEKSARAGGTLHLGVENGLLPSDNIRFSSSTFASEEAS
jgi:hypothetical protein